jgi:hypothetical protein
MNSDLSVQEDQYGNYQIVLDECLGVTPSWLSIYHPLLDWKKYIEIVTTCNAQGFDIDTDSEYYVFEKEEDAEKALTMILLTQ